MNRIMGGVVVLCAVFGAWSLEAQGGSSPAVGPAEPVLAIEELAVPWARVVVKSAAVGSGIRGRVRGLETSVFFESRRIDGDLRSIIVGPRGEVLYEYREFGHRHREIGLGEGRSFEVEEPPQLEILGVRVESWAFDGLASVRLLASQPEARLIRQLGLELVGKAPGDALIAERRGLELATQALWPYLEEASGPLQGRTADYEINAAGFVVLTQPERLTLDVNRLPARVALRHDDDAVGGCYGRCGGGCTGGFAGIDMFWLPPSSWSDAFGPEVPVHQQVRCVSGEDWIDTSYAKWTTHTVSGWWTEGCRHHDDCCRNFGTIGCLTICNALVPMVAETMPSGRLVTWTYSDYTWTRSSSYNAGYSGCTCSGQSPYEEQYECVQ